MCLKEKINRNEKEFRRKDYAPKWLSICKEWHLEEGIGSFWHLSETMDGLMNDIKFPGTSVSSSLKHVFFKDRVGSSTESSETVCLPFYNASNVPLQWSRRNRLLTPQRSWLWAVWYLWNLGDLLRGTENTSGPSGKRFRSVTFTLRHYSC